MDNDWTPASSQLPEIGIDVLVYSTTMRGYAVGVRQLGISGDRWLNSTNGQEFPPRSITHWMSLPNPPAVFSVVGNSGYESYRPN